MASRLFTYANGWEIINPRQCHSSVLCRHIPAHICSGDYIKVQIGSTEHACRVIDIRFDVNPPQLFVQVWLTEEDVPSTVSLEPINITTDNRVVGMIGVICTNWTRWVLAESVKDFAFIFHRDSLNAGMFANAHGMANAYYSRYRLFTIPHGTHAVSSLNANEHVSFSHLISPFFLQTAHHRIFMFLTEMKRNADTVLWTERKFCQANGIGRCAPVFINKDCWDYFCHRLKKNKSFVHNDLEPKHSKRTIRTFFYNLSSQAISLPVDIFYVEAETVEQFACLRKIFGTAYGYGVRRAKVTKSSGLASLSVAERINALDYFSDGNDHSSNDQNEEDAPELNNKVIFSFNAFTSVLLVRYYYRYMRVESERGRALLREINHHLSQVGDNNLIMEQSTFMFENVLYRTLPYAQESTTITCIDLFSGGNERVFSVEHARELINEHNRNESNLDNDL